MCHRAVPITTTAPFIELIAFLHQSLHREPSTEAYIALRSTVTSTLGRNNRSAANEQCMPNNGGETAKEAKRHAKNNTDTTTHHVKLT